MGSSKSHNGSPLTARSGNSSSTADSDVQVSVRHQSASPSTSSPPDRRGGGKQSDTTTSPARCTKSASPSSPRSHSSHTHDQTQRPRTPHTPRTPPLDHPQPSLSILSYLDQPQGSPSASPAVNIQRKPNPTSPPRTLSDSRTSPSPYSAPKQDDTSPRRDDESDRTKVQARPFPTIAQPFGEAEGPPSRDQSKGRTTNATSSTRSQHRFSDSQSSAGSPPNLSLSSSITLTSENGSSAGDLGDSHSNAQSTDGRLAGLAIFSGDHVPRPFPAHLADPRFRDPSLGVGALGTQSPYTELSQRRPLPSEKGLWGFPQASLKSALKAENSWDPRLGHLPPITTSGFQRDADQQYRYAQPTTYSFGPIPSRPILSSIPRGRTNSLQNSQHEQQGPYHGDFQAAEGPHSSRRIISIARPRPRTLPGLQHFFQPNYSARQVSDSSASSNSLPASPSNHPQNSLSLPPFFPKQEDRESLRTMSALGRPSDASGQAFDGDIGGGHEAFGGGMGMNGASSHLQTMSGGSEHSWMSPTSMASNGAAIGGEAQRDSPLLAQGNEHDAHSLDLSQASASMAGSGAHTPRQGPGPVTIQRGENVPHEESAFGTDGLAKGDFQHHPTRPLAINSNVNYGGQAQYLVPIVRKGQEYHYDSNYPIQSASSYTFGVSNHPSAVDVPHFPHSAAAAYQQPAWGQQSQGQFQSPHLLMPNGGGFQGTALQHRDSSMSANSPRPGSADFARQDSNGTEQVHPMSTQMQIDEPSAFATAMHQQVVQTGGGATMVAISQGQHQQQQQQQQQQQYITAKIEPDSPLDYERQRLTNIKSNEQLMVSLGLQGSPSSHSRMPTSIKALRRNNSSLNLKFNPIDRKRMFKTKTPSMHQLQPISYSDMSGDGMQPGGSDESFSTNSEDDDGEWAGQESGSDEGRSRKRPRASSDKKGKWRKSRSRTKHVQRESGNTPTLRELFSNHPKLRETYPLFYAILGPDMYLDDAHVPTIGTIPNTVLPVDKAELLRQFYHKGRRCIAQLDAFTQRCDKKYDGAGDSWRPLDHAMKIAIRDVRRKVVERCENYKYTRRDLLNKALGRNCWDAIEEGWISWRIGDHDPDPANDLEGFSLESPPANVPGNRVMAISPMKMGAARKRSHNNMSLSRKPSRGFGSSSRSMSRKQSVVYESPGGMFHNNSQYSDVRGGGKAEQTQYQSNRMFQKSSNERLVSVDEYSSEDGGLDETTQNGTIVSGQVGVFRNPTSGVEQQFVITSNGQAYMLNTPVTAQQAFTPITGRMTSSTQRHQQQQQAYTNAMALPQPVQIQMAHQPMQMMQHSPMIQTPIPHTATGQDHPVFPSSSHSQGSHMSHMGMQHGGMQQQMGVPQHHQQQQQQQQQQQHPVMMHQAHHSPDMQHEGQGAGVNNNGAMTGTGLTFTIPGQGHGMSVGS